MSDDGHLAFGSSEFFISKDKVAQCPQAVFGEQVCGVDLTYVGEAYDQSLWQAIAAGAYGSAVQNKKAMIVVSPQWFFKNNGDQGKFASKFSSTLYRQFADNPSISDETKAYVRSRVEQLGVDAKTTAAAHRDTVLDAVERRGRGARRRPAPARRASGRRRERAAQEPRARRGRAHRRARLERAARAGRRVGRRRLHHERLRHLRRVLAEELRATTWSAGRTSRRPTTSTPTSRCFLDVCREAGLEPLVVILPVHGAWYDREGVPATSGRRTTSASAGCATTAGAAYADFSTCEYEKYFLCDTVHPGWRGWVRIEQAFYDFVHDRDDAFLGGGSVRCGGGLDAAGNAGASLAGAGEEAS